MKHTRLWIAGLALGALGAPVVLSPSHAAPAKKSTKKAAAKKPAKKPASNGNLQPLKLSLPAPAFLGTPKNLPPGLNLERPTGKARPTFYVPKGTVLLSKNKPVTSSDSAPVIGELSLITDGSKEAGEGYFVELGPFKQHVQIDLGRSAAIYAIAVWHHHSEPAVYKDVVVQVSDDADFANGVKTVYNADNKGTLGLGRGGDKQYFESAEGRLINARGVRGRYVRLYSNGSTSDDANRYTEVEVYGK